ncbi:MAG: UbiA family prenyltransferase [Planctomycetota bacterium]|nr:UbiA family prenyltransferase [Planctomycetota bacterium]
MSLLGFGRLIRISLAPSAAADVVAGLVFASGGRFPSDARAWWLVPASLCVYHGALALNDWNDRAHDAVTRPTRPLPAGEIASGRALAVGLALVVAGVALAALAAPRCAVWYGILALLALTYDWIGRGAIVGPLLLAACRALNLGAGIYFVAGDETARFATYAPCLVYGSYVFAVSRLGRMEDKEDGAPLARRPSVWLNVIGLVLFAFLAVPEVVRPERAVVLTLAVTAAFGLWRTAYATTTWTRGLVERAMGLCLRRLLVCAAIVALLRARFDVPDAWIAALAILAGYPLAHALRRSFPPS